MNPEAGTWFLPITATERSLTVNEIGSKMLEAFDGSPEKLLKAFVSYLAQDQPLIERLKQIIAPQDLVAAAYYKTFVLQSEQATYAEVTLLHFAEFILQDKLGARAAMSMRRLTCSFYRSHVRRDATTEEIVSGLGIKPSEEISLELAGFHPLSESFVNPAAHIVRIRTVILIG